VIKNFTWGILTAVLVLLSAGESAFAQVGGVGGGMGGGTNMQRPTRRLHKSRAPVLSPALNLVPGNAASFEGQFLLRQLPQEQALREYQRTGKTLDKLQDEVTDNENQVKSGVKKTGHRTQFMSYGSYYSFSGGRGGRR
jgi:hypothetical protein